MRNYKPKLRLDKISQSSSPDHINKEITSPFKTGRGRVMIGGMGDSYLSFFKIENEIQPKYPNSLGQHKKIQINKHSIAQKDQIINNLQQKIMKQTLKKNARQKCFQERLNTDWKKHIEFFIRNIAIICTSMSKNNRQHKKGILKILHQCYRQKGDQRSKILAILAWILQWMQPILKMFHQMIKNKYH